jgi:predicted P-loop ATPase
MLIFESSEGKRKSSVIRALCPNPDWFSESLPAITPHTMKEVQEHMLGIWLIEMPDLASFRKADVEHLKAFLTTTVDQFRIPWGTRTEQHPRHCSFFGTTNSIEYMSREDGNRRFWPIKIGSRIDTKWIEDNRDQLWAEAAVAYLSREDWWLSEEVEALAKVEQKARRQPEPWEALVEGIVAGMPTPITMESVFEGLTILAKDRTMMMERRIGAILRELGWTVKQVTIRGQRRNRWFPPDEPSHLRLVEDDDE